MNPERRLFLSRSASAVFGLAAVAGLRAAEGTSAAATLPALAREWESLAAAPR